MTVIVTADSRFYELYPARDFSTLFENNEQAALDMFARNVPMQGAYMILAARALDLDAGPMSGFNAEKIDLDFFSTGRWRSNFICKLGYGDKANLCQRNPRLAFDEACQII